MFHFFSNLGSFVNSGSSFTVGYLLSELSPQSRRENTMGTPGLSSHSTKAMGNGEGAQGTEPGPQKAV